MMPSEAYMRQMAAALKATQERVSQLQTTITELSRRPRSLTEEIDSIQGRRIMFTLSGETTFTTANDGQAGTPVTFLVSQDGPYVMTHYPVIAWKPSLPTTATNLGRWSPIRSFPMSTQQVTTTIDIIDVSYQFTDAGSQRLFQNLSVSSQLISYADNIIPLPVPTLFAPNTTIQITPIYDNIAFAAPATPTTTGTLHIDLPGYRIVNM
jgi:hypothetical protein